METLVSAVQKLVIKDVVLYADEKIAVTTQVIAQNLAFQRGILGLATTCDAFLAPTIGFVHKWAGAQRQSSVSTLDMRVLVFVLQVYVL